MPRYRQPNTPTIAGVNVLYLIAMVLLITLGIMVQQWSPVWGLVITELVVILLPALIFLRVRHLPVRATLRLRRPGWDLILLSPLIGAGLWFFDAVIDSLMAQILGYSPGTMVQTPTMTPLDAVGFALGMALLPPVCEEILFRGIIQRGYERRGPQQAILIGGLLFAFYHLRFQGLLGLTPIAMVLGYAFWRSQSLVIPILIHLTNNALGVIRTLLQAFNSPLEIETLFVFAVGPIVIVGALWLFHRRTRGMARPVPPAPITEPVWRYLPLIAAIGIYIVFAGFELVRGRFPGLMARETLPLTSAPWTDTAQWHYELRLQVTEERVGEAVCEVTPDGDVWLVCEVDQTAFDIQIGNSRWVGGDVTQTTRAQWSAETLQLEGAELIIELPDTDTTVEVTRIDGDLTLTTKNGDVVTLPDEALLIGGGSSVVLAGEAPWRLSALAFDEGSISKATVVEPFRWQQELERAAPLVHEAVVTIEGSETVALPDGDIIAWRVRLGEDRAGWYAETAPHPLVQYETGILRWVLVSAP